MSDDDQMWVPVTVQIATTGLAGPTFRVWPAPEQFRPISPRLHPDDLEAIARRVAEMLRGAP